jgi:hypothetical protein
LINQKNSVYHGTNSLLKPPKIFKLAALGTVVAWGFSVRPAQAGYLVTLGQVGANVVATGNGAIDLTGLNFFGSTIEGADIQPFFATIRTGASAPVDIYTGATGPKNFGSGFYTPADSSSGDSVAISGSALFVPQNYMSGQPLSDTTTYDNATFADLGVRGGLYEWTWGSGPNQNFTLKVGVPDSPPGLSLITVVFLLLVGVKAFQLRGSRRRAFLQS